MALDCSTNVRILLFPTIELQVFNERHSLSLVTHLCPLLDFAQRHLPGLHHRGRVLHQIVNATSEVEAFSSRSSASLTNEDIHRSRKVVNVAMRYVDSEGRFKNWRLRTGRCGRGKPTSGIISSYTADDLN